MFLKHQSNCSKVSRHEGGFSLIEVAIALIVISIIMAATLQTYNIYALQKQENDTKNHIDTVASALSKYAEKNGRYPRPANRNIQIGTLGFGKEAPIPTVLCTTNTAVSCLSTAGTVYMGDIPFAALGINYKSTIDAFGSKLTYAVTASLTTTYVDTGGAIQVKANDGSIQYVGITPKAHFFVYSSGPDRRGTYSLMGNPLALCGTAVNGDDFENCNGDETFRSNYENDIAKTETFGKYIRYFSTGTRHFDDIAGYQNSSAPGIWKLSSTVGSLINTNTQAGSTAGGNVMIGTPVGLAAGSCSAAADSVYGCIVPPKTSVDVVGTTLATEIRTKRMCPYGAVGCTEPASGSAAGINSPTFYAGASGATPIPNTSGTYNATTLGNAGGGILCPSRTALKGFHYTSSTNYVDELCIASIPVLNPVTLGTCPVAGTYANGVTALGVLKCIP